MKKRRSINIGAIVCLLAAIYLIYYLLLQDNVLPFSIASVHANISHWAKDKHALVAAFLPVYVALMIFGASVVGIYLGTRIQNLITRWIGHH